MKASVIQVMMSFIKAVPDGTMSKSEGSRWLSFRVLLEELPTRSK